MPILLHIKSFAGADTWTGCVSLSHHSIKIRRELYCGSDRCHFQKPVFSNFWVRYMNFHLILASGKGTSVPSASESRCQYLLTTRPSGSSDDVAIGASFVHGSWPRCALIDLPACGYACVCLEHQSGKMQPRDCCPAVEHGFLHVTRQPYTPNLFRPPHTVLSG